MSEFISDDILDNDFLDSESNRAYSIERISTLKFSVLCFFTMGIYPVWWNYKLWRFFKNQDVSNIIPAARAIFLLIFLYPLMTRVKKLALSSNVDFPYSPVLLFIGYFMIYFLYKLPSALYLLSILAFIPLLPVVKSFNESMLKSYPEFSHEQDGFNTKQIAIMILGAALTLFTIYVELFTEL